MGKKSTFCHISQGAASDCRTLISFGLFLDNGSKQWQSQNKKANQQKDFNEDKYGWKINPLISNRNITKCSICQSICHWFKDCSHKLDDSTDDNHVKLSLFTDDLYNCYIAKFVGETLKHAVLDGGCTKNVCGVSWLESYLETLSEVDKKKVAECSSDSKFKFGDGKTADSITSPYIPA